MCRRWNVTPTDQVNYRSKSDSVVQGYIDNSMVQIRTSADALSVSGQKKRRITDENRPQNVYNIFGSNCVINFHSSTSE